MELKYIIIQPYSYGNVPKEKVAVLFPSLIEELTHKDVAQIHRAGHRAVVSAGFCEVIFERKKVITFGFSETLKMGPAAGDSAIIEKMFGF
jgi:hypothetical protein